MFLAAIGIHGLLADTVAQQRQEIGFRLALGEMPGRIARRVVRNGLAIGLLGMVPGLLLGFAAGRRMSALLFGVPPNDPATFVLTASLRVTMSATGACLRAGRVSPMTAMHTE